MDHLLQAAVRSVLLAAVAAAIVRRVKSASVRHAVWTLVTTSMMVQMAIGPLLPELPLRVLHSTELHSAEPVAVAVTSQAVPIVESSPAKNPQAILSWEQFLAALYFSGLFFFAARFVFALLFARRLVRGSEPAIDGACESHRVAAPMTIGNRILLPLSWRGWDSAKLHAVLAHEQAHVRRRDWAIAAMARLNRCVFWFHPLAWWLERQLARLAEQACDDAALMVVKDREQYARTLLDVARAIQFSKGRVLAVSNVAAPMAKEANVETRIDRILDETRRIPRALGRRGWTALALCASPVMYLAAAIQLAPAQTVVAPAPPAPPAPPPVVRIAQAPAPTAAPAPPTPPTQPMPPTPTPPQPPVPPQPPAGVTPPQPPIPPQPPAAALAPEPPAPPQPPAPQADGPAIRIPKVYNGQNKTFFFFNYEEYLNQKRQLQEDSDSPKLPKPAQLKFPDQVPAPPAATSAADDSPLHVAVTSLRVTWISIPLDASGQFLVSGRITTPANKFVTSFDEQADYRESVEKEIPLKAGSYRLDVTVKNRSDGKITTQVINFKVE